jgi:hypothetical protein
MGRTLVTGATRKKNLMLSLFGFSITLEYSDTGFSTDGKRVTDSGKNARKYAPRGILPAVFLDSASLPEQASVSNSVPRYF